MIRRHQSTRLQQWRIFDIALVLGLSLLSGCQWQKPVAIPVQVPSLSASSDQPAQKAIPHKRLLIQHLSVRGNSVLAEGTLATWLAHYQPRDYSLLELKAVAKQLEDFYHQQGYVTTRVVVPPQAFGSGNVYLQVHEGRVGRMDTNGARALKPRRLREFLPKEHSVLNITQMRRGLAVANRMPGRTMHVDLSPGADNHSTDLAVSLRDDTRWSGKISGDNEGNEESGNYRITSVFRLHNLFRRDHSAGINYVTAWPQPERVQIWGLFYHVPLGIEGGGVSVYAARSDVESRTRFEGINIAGEGHVLRMDYAHPLPSLWGMTHRLNAGLEYQRIKDAVDQVGVAVTETRHSLYPFDIGYHVERSDAYGLTVGSLVARGHYPGINSHADLEDIDAQRSGADGHYWMLRYNLERHQPLVKGLTGILRASAQTIDEPVTAGEQFTVGGAQSVRGYRRSEMSDDAGASVQAEIRSPVWQSIPALSQRFGLKAQALVFGDYGAVRNQHPLAGEDEKRRIRSAGFGLRLSFAHDIEMRIDGARAYETATVTRHGDHRLHVNVGWSF